MKKTIIFILGLLWPVLLLSQNFQWAVSCGKGEYDDYGVISSNQQGEIFLTGYYYPPGIFGEDTLGWEYLPRMLTKIDASGNFEWTKGIHVTGQPCSDSKTIFVGACKKTDDAFFIGHFCGDLYFDTIHLTSTELKIIISKYDGDGNCLWAKQPGGSVGTSMLEVEFDDQDNFYILGWVNDTAYFDGHFVEPGRMVAKFSPNGICTGIFHISQFSGDAFLNKICPLRDGGILFAGFTTGPSTIVGTDTLISPHIWGYDLLLAKYDSSGNYLWSKLDGHTGAVLPSNEISVKEDTLGNFYVCGRQCCDSLVFGNHTIPYPGPWQTFLVKYDPDGNALWAVNSQNKSNDTFSVDLYISDDNKIYLTGGIESITPTDTISFGSCWATGINGYAMYVVCYDSNGDCLGLRYSSESMVPASMGSPQFYGTSVTADNNGTCIVAGEFMATALFDSYSITSKGMRDIFIARCTPIIGGEAEKSIPQNQLLIYANPNTGKCNITVPEEFNNEDNLILKIIDVKGKVIQQSRVEFTEGKIKLDIRAQAKGMYTAVLSNGKKSYLGKIVFE